MAFSIQDVRQGTARVFTTRELLELIGDAVNDEIRIDGEIFRISSCQDVGQGGGTVIIDWVAAELPITINGQVSFYTPDFIDDAQSVLLTVNNVLYAHGIDKDYHVDGDRIYWHGGFTLETDDRIFVRYPMIIS